MSGAKPSPMWAEYSRQGLSIATTATSFGFLAALKSTQFGFSIARGVTTTAVSVGSSITDRLIYGGNAGTGEAVNEALKACFTIAESLATAPILLGQSITSTSLVLASSSIEALPNLFGSEEASYSLGAFVELIKREWQNPIMAEHLPEKRYSVLHIARALVAWAGIQAVTTEWAEKRWLSSENVEEVDMDEWLAQEQEEAFEMGMLDVPRNSTFSARNSIYSINSVYSMRSIRPQSEVTITSDVFLPNNGGEILAATIGEPGMAGIPWPTRDSPPPSPPMKPSYNGLRITLRRISRMVLGGYGGAGLLFFGVPLPHRGDPLPSQKKEEPPVDERTSLLEVVHSAEHDEFEAMVQPSNQSIRAPSVHVEAARRDAYGWWSLVTGKHDQELFEGFAFASATHPTAKAPSAVISQDARFPRFWILTDHGRRQIVLVLRGTMSLNEVAIDLTCESTPFEPASSGKTPSPSSPYLVHSGMLQLAQSMGLPGMPLHLAIRTALLKNRGYELVLSGHSLGAGVAALLALMWADPTTCLTSRSAGFPSGRRVNAYCFAPPGVTSVALSQLASSMITSFVYSYDVVSRLSLGAVRDIMHASAWLCYGKENPEESCQHIAARALLLQKGPKFRSEAGAQAEGTWFLSLRKTLEANMQMSELYPPGRVFWAVWNKDLHPSNQTPSPEFDLRLFRVKKVDKVFSQIIFSRDMLSSHMPHLYDGILHENL